MMDRRELLGMAAFGTLAAASGVTSLAGRTVEAAVTKELKYSAPNFPRGVDGRLLRLGTIDVESRQEFTAGFRQMQARIIRKTADEALTRVLEQEGIDPAENISMSELRRLIENEPAINISPKTWLANQRVTWKNLQDHYHANADMYLSQMERTDKAGPGTLELAPSMKIPDHAAHQIHIQPGGYVGDPFAGHMYHYGTNSFYIGVRGHNDQDQIHREAVANLPVPKDRKVKRILDYGCGIGQLTVALKERFPDAEVWGLDIGGPMVRYGHMRAANLGVDVNFVQRLAEDNGFPDNYFDIVTSYIAHHEFPADVTRQAIAEVQRVSRPGAVYYPIDFITGGREGPPRSMFGRWWDHRWNNEPWTLEYHAMDFEDEIGTRGFQKAKDSQPVVRGFGSRHFVRV
ncbi:class I SAM-dependent methyltransferase [Haliea sp. E1-2-M8]|uniref:class I SAM-dependent methyltransferase n=1 Tax=Haliea sp. E1-2-M8 TaxID=3064706 RepID=UPI00271B9A8A|nr:class I SAM-dependent methyltransferase [Haliea sp. E1-2-M8]MDO8864188.1 class I SAM-dependent methyltransferase [Haliea sp. E1-2-M8]